MPRARFEQILRYMHVSDNTLLDPQDKFTKIRPLWDNLNERWMRYSPRYVEVSIDESMIPYYGHHSTKQHIHGKPIRFGYKVWCMATRLGYLIQAEHYQGASAGNTNPDLGVGGSVVTNLVSKLPDGFKVHVYMDNFLTSLRLLTALKQSGHQGTGTIRANRVEKAPLESLQSMKSKSRGSYHQITDEKSYITLIRYNDNNVVTVASSCEGVAPMGSAQRWSSNQKRKIAIQQPSCIQQYNRYMGGTDRLDQNVGCYRMVKNPLDYLAFIRVITTTYLGKYSNQRTLGRPLKPTNNGEEFRMVFV
ncbi:piggyBac transposable element-derived protein 3-like [Rhagoletis pomonella]|uniref:piggyBac transposable element-derived protein 3-like n=1 Tax=Rhagoletis pomonella TaxID=28610 RepID=UPI0017877842|nr:piggyBac transposable element-derived protein 3-like [Rhagoletis pomonella]